LTAKLLALLQPKDSRRRILLQKQRADVIRYSVCMKKRRAVNIANLSISVDQKNPQDV
jgi:hypothetical protein